MVQGYKKLSGFMTTIAASEIGGQKIIQFFWDQWIAKAGVIDPMPDDVAFGLFVMLGAFIFWLLREDPPEREMVLVPARHPEEPAARRPAGGDPAAPERMRGENTQPRTLETVQ